MKTTNVGHVKLDPDSPIRLAVRRRTLPIIIVPDLMGTRLTDPATKKLAWNPTGFPLSALAGATPGPFACDYERLQQISAALVPDDHHPTENEGERQLLQHIKHYDHLVTPHYGALAQALARLDYLPQHADAGPFGVKTSVYCCGYDWRQDNVKSALRLAEVVEEALRDTGEEKVLIVAHGAGGLIARHYCRALGGESKVFAMFALGSPILGAPSAYTQLKDGIPGLYLREAFQSEESTASRVVSVAGSAVGSIARATSDGMSGFLGPLYSVLVLGAGRLLTKHETIYFARQLQSVYQLMPGAVFSDHHRLWNFFDPLNTGHAPSGYLIKFPTLLDATVALTALTVDAFTQPASTAADDLTAAANEFLHGGGDRSNVALTGANSETLAEAVAAMAALIAGGGAGIDGTVINRVVARMTTIIERVTESFVDCRNNRKLYRDIFTGLSDVLDLRAVSSYNLELALRSDDALLVQPREVPHLTPAALFGAMMGGVYAAFRAVGASAATVAAERATTAQTQQEEERTRSKAYVHPKTIAYATSDLSTDGGCILLCLDIKSNYDSNVAEWQLLPNLIGHAMSAPGAGADPSALYYGDGTVPLFSAKPPDALLSHPLHASSRTFTGVNHMALASETQVHDALKTHIAELVPAWYGA